MPSFSHAPYVVRYCFWLTVAVLDRALGVDHYNPYLPLRYVARLKARGL
jgi:hypothetical protein